MVQHHGMLRPALAVGQLSLQPNGMLHGLSSKHFVQLLGRFLQISRGSVYSLHKSSTRQYLQKFAVQQLKAKSAEVLAQLRYDLPSTFVFHK